MTVPQPLVAEISRAVRQLFPARWAHVSPRDDSLVLATIKDLREEDGVSLRAQLSPAAQAVVVMESRKYSYDELVMFCHLLKGIPLLRTPLFQASGPNLEDNVVTLTLLKASPAAVEAVIAAGVPRDALQVKYASTGLVWRARLAE